MRLTGRRLATLLSILATISASPYIVPAMAGSADGPTSRPLFPDLLLIDGSGLPFHLARYFGQAVIVLEFSAESCGPCVQDLTALDRLQGDFRNQPLIVIAVSEDGSPIGAVRQFEKRQKLGYLKPYADSAATAATALGVTSLPETFVIDRHGRLVLQIQGSQVWDNPGYQARFKMLLAQ